MGFNSGFKGLKKGISWKRDRLLSGLSNIISRLYINGDTMLKES